MKIVILLPDGVGVRNFIYSNFIDNAISESHEIIIWADKEILSLINDERVSKLPLPSLSSTTALIEIQRKAWSVGMLKHQASMFADQSFLDYIFYKKPDSFALLLKLLVEKYYLVTHRNDEQLSQLKKKYLDNVKHIKYFRECLKQLRNTNPDFVFCAVQRSSKAMAPLLASRKLNIPNASFIYSWDNLPKANLYVEADNYFVWSDLMKKDLQIYHPEINAENIYVTGTPQFVPYFDETIKLDRKTFARQNNLPIDKKWICFSGDDVTTSPYDPVYLEHLAYAVNEWNRKSFEKLHIILRPCPVDVSMRFESVLNQFKSVITEIRPLWDTLKPSGGWSYLVANREDISLLTNTVRHCEVVINLGSTMAHDFSVLGKPCIYINYNLKDKSDWDIHKIYRFAHFRSMIGLDPVIWINSQEDWIKSLKLALYDNNRFVEDCKQWHRKIALFPLEDANERLVKAISSIIERAANNVES